MANSPQKRKADSALDDQTVSRSGRVRKPKVFYDPSEMVKRRSVPITIEASKPMNKSPEQSPLTPNASPPSNVSVRPDSGEMKPPLKKSPIIEKAKTKAAAVGNSRRKTVCVSSVFDDGGNGCIVCNRSDVKKGRFVNCIDCIKRGHFTCLRTEKLFRTADSEANWQCPSCKICEFCHQNKPTEQLYKCIECLNSYHLQCSSKIAPLPKSVVKKKFTCGFCIKAASVHAKPVDPPRPVLPNRKSEGFPGFGNVETKKSDPKLNDQKPAIKKAVPFPKPTQKPPSTNSLSGGGSSNDVKTVADIEVKTEKKSPTPEIEFIGSNSLGCNNKQKVANKTISVRTDLVVPTVSQQQPMDETTSENSYDDDMDIKYDTKSAFTPDESIPDVRKWDIDEVYTYFLGKYSPEFAQLLKDHQIDGDALLLIRREDVLNRFNLKLGAALRLYSYIVSIQYKNNNPILAWNEV